MEQTYKYHLLAGPTKTFDENGKLQSVTEYKSSRKQGKFTSYYPQGGIHEQGDYMGDKKHGEWKEFDAQGNLLKTHIFKAGNLVQTTPNEGN